MSPSSTTSTSSKNNLYPFVNIINQDSFNKEFKKKIFLTENEF
jgi:hypothetical protein